MVIFVSFIITMFFIFKKHRIIRIINPQHNKGSKFKRYRKKNFMLPLFSIFFIGFLVFSSKTAISSAYKAIELWLGVVFPSMFPFLVVSEILNSTSFITVVSIIFKPIMRPLFNLPGCASYPLFLGITGGCPIGAKTVSSIRKNDRISKIQGSRLLPLCSNSSPLFITGAIATGMLRMQDIGIFLFICHIVASLTVGVLFKFFSKTKDIDPKGFAMINPLEKPSEGNKNFGVLFSNAIVNSVSTMFSIGGFIIFFSVFTNFLLKIGVLNIISDVIYFFLKGFGFPKNLIIPVLSGFFEITSGLELICGLGNIALSSKLVLISMVLGWGGMSIYFQILSVIKDSDLSSRFYLLGKFLHSIIAGLYTYLGIRIINRFSNRYISVFNTMQGLDTSGWQKSFYIQYKCLFMLVIFSLVLILSITIYDFLKRLPGKQY